MEAYVILMALGILCALFSDKISKFVNVNTKLRVTLDIFLVILAVIVAVGNFSDGRNITYFASIVSVCGTLIFLVVDIYRIKKNK